MSNPIRLQLDIEPRAKQSFRVGKHNYQSKSVTDYQKAIRAMALEQTSAEQRNLSGPLYVSVEFVWQTPKSWTRAQVKEAQDRCVYRIARPDIDNLCKGVFDALNGIIWNDDSQIVGIHAWKRYGDADCVIMRIENYDEYRKEMK